MSTRSDEVYEGIRCAICEERFTNRDVVAVLWDTGERRHYECPTTPEVVIDTPAKRSPDGFVAQRFPESFNNRGHWLVTRMGPGGLEVEVFTDEAVTDWPALLDERYLEIGS